MTDKILAISAFSENIRPLYERWAKTLPASFTPVVKIIEIPNDGYGFCKDSWYEAIEKKIQHFVDTLTAQPDGTMCLCCDVDIFFTKQDDTLARYLVEELNSKGLDIIFMRECRTVSVNGGFYFVRNSPKVREELTKAMLHCRKRTKYADQDFFNSKEFRSGGIKWGYVDNALVAWGTAIFNANKTLFHHAVCTTNMTDKLEQQNKIARTLKVNFW